MNTSKIKMREKQFYTYLQGERNLIRGSRNGSTNNDGIYSPTFKCINMAAVINAEIKKAEKEILDLKNKSPEKIRKIAVET